MLLSIFMNKVTLSSDEDISPCKSFTFTIDYSMSYETCLENNVHKATTIMVTYLNDSRGSISSALMTYNRNIIIHQLHFVGWDYLMETS